MLMISICTKREPSSQTDDKVAGRRRRTRSIAVPMKTNNNLSLSMAMMSLRLGLCCAVLCAGLLPSIDDADDDLGRGFDLVQFRARGATCRVTVTNAEMSE